MKILSIILISIFSLTAFAQDKEKSMKAGNYAFSKGEFNEAIEHYSKVLEIEPEDLNAHIQRGLCLSIVEKYDEAIKDFDAALDQDSKLVAVRNSKGSALMKQKKYDQAISEFNTVLAQDDSNQEAYNNRGWCKKKKGDTDGACADWKKSKKLGSGDAKIFMKNNGC